MKLRIYITLMLFTIVQFGNAQCVANAGGNKHVCMGMYTTTAVIGGTASGGTSPYTYCWSTNAIPAWPGSSHIFTASDFLNDTTAANPIVTINNLVDTSTTFYLKVTDALGCVSYDTCKISFTKFVYGLGNVTVYIDQTSINNGDSITINLMTVGGSSYTPNSYSWQPAYGLSTTTLATGFKALPHASTVYSVTVTDTKGCQSMAYSVYYVYVCPSGYVAGPLGGQSCLPVSIKENFANKINLSVYPNPVSNNITVGLPQSNAYSMKLNNVLGSVYKEISFAEEKTEIDLSHLNRGIYFLQVFEKGNLVATKKIIKE